MEEIIEARIQFRTHQEETAVNSGEHDKLRNTACKVTLEKVEMAFFEEPEKHHAEQVFKNTDRSKNMEETVLGIVAFEPKVVGKAKEGCPQNTRNKERSEKHPERAIALFEKPAAKPGSHRVAYEETRQRPRRFIQFHAQIGHNGPSKRDMQKEASPRVGHFCKACGKAVADFRESGQVRVTAELEDEHQEHEDGHEEVQAVKLGDAGEHEGDYRNTAFRIAKLAREKKTGEHVEDAGGKGGRINDRHDPLVVGHVIEGRRRAQVQHHDVNACEESKAVKSRKIIRFCFFHKKLFIVTLIREI